jgi:tetratricopeptide (TPR) repeat protein
MIAAEKYELGAGGVNTWLAWVLLLRDEMDDAELMLEEADRSGSRGHQPFLRQVQADHLAEAGHWDRVPAFATEARRYAADAALRALPIHIDRLQGRDALAGGDHASAVDLLERAGTSFASLGARWDRARTDVFLAEALAAEGRGDEARRWLADAIAVLDALGDRRGLDRARSLGGRLS